MRNSHFINRTMNHIDQSVEIDNMPVAGQVWLDEYGVAYTIISVRNREKTVNFQEPGKVRSAKVYSTWVTAFTFDLSEENANGQLNGVPAHFISEVRADKFVGLYIKVNQGLGN